MRGRVPNKLSNSEPKPKEGETLTDSLIRRPMLPVAQLPRFVSATWNQDQAHQAQPNWEYPKPAATLCPQSVALYPKAYIPWSPLCRQTVGLLGIFFWPCGIPYSILRGTMCLVCHHSKANKALRCHGLGLPFTFHFMVLVRAPNGQMHFNLEEKGDIKSNRYLGACSQQILC